MLTGKQKAFADAVSSGKYVSLSDAYKATYNAGRMSPTAINKEASRLAAHPHIAPLIEGQSRALERRKATAVASRQISIQETVLSRLNDLSLNGEPADNVRLQATIALGKTVGMFKEKVEHTAPDDRRSSDEIMDSLISKLEELQRKYGTNSAPERRLLAPVDETECSNRFLV